MPGQRRESSSRAVRHSPCGSTEPAQLKAARKRGLGLLWQQIPQEPAVGPGSQEGKPQPGVKHGAGTWEKALEGPPLQLWGSHLRDQHQSRKENGLERCCSYLVWQGNCVCLVYVMQPDPQDKLCCKSRCKLNDLFYKCKGFHCFNDLFTTFRFYLVVVRLSTRDKGCL